MAAGNRSRGGNYDSNERTPLLSGQGSQQQYEHSEEPSTESFEDVQAAAEAIRESLPMTMVVPSLIAALSGLFITAIDSTLVVALVGSISSTFAATDRVFWLSSAYLLTMCAFAPIWGRLADVVGRKSCMITAVCLFGLGTLLCTVAPTMDALIVARGIQGIGGAGIQPSSSIVINDLIPMRSRGMCQAIAQLIFSMGYALGGPLGGFLNDSLGWRFAFTIQLPPIVLSIVLLSVFLKLPNLPKTASEQKRKAEMEGKPLRSVLWARLDPIGATLLISSVVAMLLSLSLMTAYDLNWSDTVVWAGLATSFVLLLVFLYVEVRVSQEPLVPLRMVEERSLPCIWIVYFLMSFVVSMLFYFPFYFIVILEQTSTQIGFHYLPVSFATMLGSFVAGGFLKRTGRYRTLSIILSVICIVTPAWLATWTDTNRPSPFSQNAVLTPSAFAGASLNTLLQVALMAIAGQQDVAGAVSLLYFFRALGSIMGTSIMGSLIQKILIAELSKRIRGHGAQKTIDLIRKDIGAIASLPARQHQAAVESYSIALRTFEITLTAISVVVVGFVLLIKERNLNGSPSKTPPTTQSSSEEQRNESGEGEEGSG